MKTIIVIGDNNPAGITERVLARMVEKEIEHEVLTVDQAKERGIPVPPADYLEKMTAMDIERKLDKDLEKIVLSLRQCKFDDSIPVIEDIKASANIFNRAKKIKIKSKQTFGRQDKGKLRRKRF